MRIFQIENTSGERITMVGPSFDGAEQSAWDAGFVSDRHDMRCEDITDTPTGAIIMAEWLRMLPVDNKDDR